MKRWQVRTVAALVAIAWALTIAALVIGMGQ